MNGYCQIKINGLSIGLKYGMPAMRFIAERVPKTEFLDAEIYSVNTLSEILYSGYKNNCIVKRTEPTLEFELFFDFVEDAESSPEDTAELMKAIQEFTESKYIKRSEEVKEPDGETEKKNPLTGTTLNDLPMENSGLVLNSTAG